MVIASFTKFYASIFIQYVDITKFSVAAVRHLGFVGESRRTTHEGPFVVALQCKKKFDMIGLIIINYLNFESHIHVIWAQNVSFRRFDSQNSGEHRSTPQKSTSVRVF